MSFPKFSLQLLIFLLIFQLLGSFNLVAKVNFSEIRKEKIDLEAIKINKTKVFDFLGSTIKHRRKGLGAYGRVSFNLCKILIDGQPLEDYKSLKGREIRFLSNPSCEQALLQKILENDYQYKKESLSKYGNRECLISTGKIFSPLMEYYTILFEEKSKNCPGCAQAEKKRLQKIAAIQNEIAESCKQENDKILHFLEDLDQIIESAYKEKMLN